MKNYRSRGAQAVEFALVLPFFLALLLLVVDFGFLVYDKAVITNASREAARGGTVLTSSPWSTAAVATVACNYARNSLVSTSGVAPNASCSGVAGPHIEVLNSRGNVPPQFGDPITVTVSYRYPGLLRTMMGIAHGTAPASTTIDWASTGNLQASTTMIHE